MYSDSSALPWSQKFSGWLSKAPSVAEEDMTTSDPFQHRRAGDSEFVSHARAAHTGISMGWQWAQILATIVMCGFSAGVFYMKALSLEASINSLQVEVRTFRESASSLATKAALSEQVDQVQNEKIAQLIVENRELRGQLDMMRSMREAYVYDAAKRSRRNGDAPAIAP